MNIIDINIARSQVSSLAKSMNCRLVQEPNMPGMMFVEHGYVEIPIINNQIDYLINLHELGHFHHNHTQGRPSLKDPNIKTEKFYFENGVLKSEAQAWEYALDCCILNIEDTSRKFMWDTCLGSYYQYYLQMRGNSTTLGNGNRHYVEFIFDHPDDYFTSIVKRIQKNQSYNIKYIGKINFNSKE